VANRVPNQLALTGVESVAGLQEQATLNPDSRSLQLDRRRRPARRKPHYRRKADECLANSKTSGDPQIVSDWLELAAVWEELAGDAERRHRDRH